MIDRIRFKRGNPEYFRELMDRYGPLARAVAAAFESDTDHGEDLYQLIWTRVFDKRASFTEQGSFEGWLHQLARGVCLNDRRQRQSYRLLLERFVGESRGARAAAMPPVEPRDFSRELMTAMANSPKGRMKRLLFGSSEASARPR